MSAEAIDRRIVRPRDCAFVFGVPIDFAGFRRDLDTPGKDFVPNCYPIWREYEEGVVEPARQLIVEARNLGATVVTDAELTTVVTAFSHSVVVLVTHWVEESIELADGIYPVQRIVDTVPHEYDGFVDLCICHPDSLALTIRSERPRTMIRYSRVKASAEHWFAYYRALLRTLAAFDRTYPDASAEILTHFMTRSDE